MKNLKAFLYPSLWLLAMAFGLGACVYGGMPVGQQRRKTNHWREKTCLLLSMWAVCACAQVPQPIPQAARNPGNESVATAGSYATTPKVQTLEELMRTLKRGWDERRLDDPNFYAKELGYPVERPETFNVYGARDSYRVIRFDEGEIKGLPMPVHPMVIEDGRQALVVNAPTSPPMPCLRSDVLFEIWGPKQPTMPEVWGAHGMPMFWRYDYAISDDVEAAFDVRKQTSCLHRFSLTQFAK